LSIIVPTFNERSHVVELVQRLTRVLGIHAAWEVLFVDDDSPDGTADLVRELAGKNSHVRCLQRIERRGLSSGCLEGMLSSSAPYLAVIGADLRHDECLLPQMLDILRRDDIDIVVGSRELTDRRSGFFMMQRAVLGRAAHRLSGMGYRILTDLFAASPAQLRCRELPYRFLSEAAVASAVRPLRAWDYSMLVVNKFLRYVVPARLAAFYLVVRYRLRHRRERQRGRG